LKIFGKTAIAVGLAGAIGFGALMSSTVAAFAAPSTQLAQTGSDTTYFLMGEISDAYNGSQGAVNVTQVPPSNVTALGFPSSVTVPSDGTCGAFTFDSSDLTHTPPNGSSAGIAALESDAAGGGRAGFTGPGCFDSARSSRGRGGTDSANDEFTAFALDGVSWSYNFKNKTGVKDLTPANLKDIYTCHTSGPQNGKPFVTNWNQVGGSISKAIVKYAPQAGSGTLSFFQTKLLSGATVDAGCDASHLSIRAEENQFTKICDPQSPTTTCSDSKPVQKATLPGAIFPYSYAKWTAQKSGHESDVRNGMILGKVNGKTPTKKTLNEGASRFLGTRYVYNVLNVNEPDYDATAAFEGINSSNGTNGFVCSDSATVPSIISHNGFVPLPSKPEGDPNDLTGRCRYEPTPL
jgi:phosphate transport system substrate-binding protein